jgi:hypothetical protein
MDVLDWSESDWYTTPVTKFAKYTKLETLKPATLCLQLGVFGKFGNWCGVPIRL